LPWSIALQSAFNPEGVAALGPEGAVTISGVIFVLPLGEFLGNPGSDFPPFAFFLLRLKQCLPRIGMRQSGKVSKTVNSCVALLRMRQNQTSGVEERGNFLAVG
jgi:hypothetical protein